MKYLIFENNPDKIKFYDDQHVDRIVIDLEIIGKIERQGHLDTVISGHKLEDVTIARSIIKNSKLVVRINPWGSYSPEEVDDVIKRGADILMLPMFKNANDVESFLKYVDGRASTILLLEHIEAVQNLSEILNLSNIDEFHIGLNDLHLSMGLNFMFELWSNGTVDKIADSIREKGIPFGVGGVASCYTGTIPGKIVIREHVRIESQSVILSRAFSKQCELNFIKDFKEMREEYELASKLSKTQLSENHMILKNLVSETVKEKT